MLNYLNINTEWISSQFISSRFTFKQNVTEILTLFKLYLGSLSFEFDTIMTLFRVKIIVSNNDISE